MDFNIFYGGALGLWQQLIDICMQKKSLGHSRARLPIICVMKIAFSLPITNALIAKTYSANRILSF